MTPTPALPAQQIATTRPIPGGSNADPAAGGASSGAGQGFESLFSQLRAQAGASGPAEAGQVAEGDGQPRRSRDARSKPLEAEDVLPMELLLTLYAQQQTPVMPMPRAAVFGQDLAMAPVLPPPDGPSTLEAAALQSIAELPQPPAIAEAAYSAQAAVASALTPTAPSTASTRAPQDLGLAAALDSQSLASAQTGQSRDQTSARAANPEAAARTAPVQAPVTAPLPADFAEQLAAAIGPAASATTVPPAPKRSPMPDSQAPAIEPEAGQPAQSTANTAPTVASAPVSAPPREPQVMRPLDAQTRPKAADGVTQTRQPQSPQRAETPADFRTAFNDLSPKQPEGSAEGDDTLPPPDRLREAAPVVIKHETALPTAGQPPVAHQAAERIIAELQSSDNAASSERAERTRQGEAPAPVRTLHIQLQPADLGTLTVKLSLRDQMLDIKLEAAEHRTARILEADREKLTEILRSAGYALDGVTVQISSPEKPVQTFNAMTGQGGNNGQPHAGAQSQAGGAQSDAQRGQGSQAGGNDDRSFASTNDGGDHAPRRGSADGDVYI